MRVFGPTERHRSRTCLASGYDAVLVLKTVLVSGMTPHGQRDSDVPHSGARRAVRQSNASGAQDQPIGRSRRGPSVAGAARFRGSL